MLQWFIRFCRIYRMRLHLWKIPWHLFVNHLATMFALRKIFLPYSDSANFILLLTIAFKGIYTPTWVVSIVLFCGLFHVNHQLEAPFLYRRLTHLNKMWHLPHFKLTCTYSTEIPLSSFLILDNSKTNNDRKYSFCISIDIYPYYMYTKLQQYTTIISYFSVGLKLPHIPILMCSVQGLKLKCQQGSLGSACFKVNIDHKTIGLALLLY